MAYVLRMIKEPEFAEVLKVISPAFGKNPKEVERAQDYLSKFISSRDANLVGSILLYGTQAIEIN